MMNEEYLTEEERGWLREAEEEVAMDAVGLCHDVPAMLSRLAEVREKDESCCHQHPDNGSDLAVVPKKGSDV
jgi:hypothetical protein